LKIFKPFVTGVTRINLILHKLNMKNYLKPLKIRNLELENNMFQAPLAGYSSAPFRELTWRLGRPGLLATEMISARAIEMKQPKQEQYLARAENEGPVAFQLWGCSESAVEYATKVCADHGADVVDLNCGCPVRKVRAAGAGSKLMEDPALIGRLVAAMRRATDIPVTIKIRVGTSPKNYNGAEVARIAESEGADLLTVHGRHTQERYSHEVRLEEVAKVVAAVKIPVIGNGDVRDGESAARMFEATGCAGVMVGRACMGAPWVFAQIAAEMTGQEWQPPEPTEMGRIMIEHYDLLVGLVGKEKAIRQSRKLGAYYTRGLKGAKHFRNSLNMMNSREELLELVAALCGLKTIDK